MTKKIRQFAGIVYLASPSDVLAETACECSVGAALFPAARGKGIGSYAVRHALNLAFGTLAFHRVSANVLGPSPLFGTAATTADVRSDKQKAKPAEKTRDASVAERAMRFFVGLRH